VRRGGYARQGGAMHRGCTAAVRGGRRRSRAGRRWETVMRACRGGPSRRGGAAVGEGRHIGEGLSSVRGASGTSAGGEAAAMTEKRGKAVILGKTANC
jgi:hypothetical protein